MKSRRLPSGEEQTVLLDWALTGISPIGDDLGQFIFGAQTNLPNVSPAEIDRLLFDNYFAGLGDSGCRLQPAVVRLGYVLSAALRVGLFQLILLDWAIRQGEPAPPPASDSGPLCFECALAEELYGETGSQIR
jgi:hypothetical protein